MPSSKGKQRHKELKQRRQRRQKRLKARIRDAKLAAHRR
jgi:hypothetical protein